MTSVHASFPYELRIGVTGHRKLADPPAIRRAVDRLLDRIDSTLERRDDTPIEWVVVSPLAKGADRVVAEAVLARPGARLEAVFPFELDEYRKDFDDPNDSAEFERLLARAEGVSYPTAPLAVDSASSQDARNEGYRRVGEAVLDRCEIVIAVWNGREAAGIGGTGDIVRYAARRNRTVLRIDSENPDAEPQLVALADPSDPHRGISGLDLRPIPEQPKQLSRGYHQLAAYNRDSALPSEVFETNCRESAALLERQADQAGLPREVLAPIIEHVVPAYVRADALANYYQKRHVASVKNLFYLSAFAVTVAVAQVLFLPAYHLVILLEILAMAGVVGLWAFSRRQAWHEKWLHDRYLAEQLRTLIFTLMLDDRQRAAPYQSVDVLPFYSRPQHWLAATVSRIADTVRKAGTSYSEHVPVRTFLAAAWLEDQLGFHRRSAAKKMHQAHRLHWLGQFLFAATLLMAILHMAGVGHPHGEEHPAPYLRLDLWITFFAIVLPVWGAAVHAVTTQLEFERIGLRSGRMAQVLERLAERTKRAQSIEELRAVIAEGERIISIENHEWWVLLSFRPPVLPA